ncbi:MAG: hypothetical protein IJ087_07905 [Eggerthellaceae bacterium]|nr:hypothetical protein [Eggerthellaceae bacterium]
MAAFSAKRFSVALSVVLSITLVFAMAPSPAYAAIAEITNKQASKVLKKYDADGYYLVSTMHKYGIDLFRGSADKYDIRYYRTNVHETCHSYFSHLWDNKYGMRYYYIGNKKRIGVTKKDVFKSYIALKSVPKRLREGRWGEYVGKSNLTVTANVYGIYGLMDEFTAYCWGMNTIVKLYPYAKAKTTNSGYLNLTSDYSVSYVEFRYFMEQYLYYAKKKKPAVYKQIMSDKKLLRAMRAIDKKFASAIKAYDKNVVDYASTNRRFDKYDAEDLEEICGAVSEYNMFVKELLKSRYTAITKACGLKNVAERHPFKAWPKTPELEEESAYTAARSAVI